jgi:RNA polymerase sigma factor (TIGR02999 family)
MLNRSGGILAQAPTGTAASHDVTALLHAWRGGDEAALQNLVPLVEPELRRVARGYMRRERAGHTLQPTALVNEAYLRLAEMGRVDVKDRAHFFALSARLMRRILVDLFRAKRNQKRGGDVRRVPFDAGLAVFGPPDEDLVAIDDALTAFARVDPRKAQVVELRFFGGLTVDETADALNVSPDTVMRDWKVAKVWLARELEKGRRHG